MDASGNGNDGTVSGTTGAATWGTTGALKFNGSDNYVDLSTHVGNLAFASTADFTVEARFRPDRFPDATATLFNLQGNGPPGVQLAVRADGIPYCGAGGAIASIEFADWDNPVAIGAFNHIVMSYDGGSLSSKLSLVVNGLLGASATGPVSFADGPFDRADIGGITYPAVPPLRRPFEGLIDEMVIYNQPLPFAAARNNYCALEALAGTLPASCTE